MCALIDFHVQAIIGICLSGVEPEESLEVIHPIDEEFMRRPFLGSHNMRDYLRCQGYVMNRKRV
jgi:hypothetical protein